MLEKLHPHSSGSQVDHRFSENYSRKKYKEMLVDYKIGWGICLTPFFPWDSKVWGDTGTVGYRVTELETRGLRSLFNDRRVRKTCRSRGLNDVGQLRIVCRRLSDENSFNTCFFFFIFIEIHFLVALFCKILLTFLSLLSYFLLLFLYLNKSVIG